MSEIISSDHGEPVDPFEAWESKQRVLVKTLEAEIERLRQREESAREFVKRHPALSLIDLAEFEAFLKLPEILGPRIDEAMAALKKEISA